jgi:hypothetical protein
MPGLRHATERLAGQWVDMRGRKVLVVILVALGQRRNSKLGERAAAVGCGAYLGRLCPYASRGVHDLRQRRGLCFVRTGPKNWQAPNLDMPRGHRITV